MGVRTLSAICAALADGGLDPDTPAAVIADGAMPSQRVVRATLATIDEAAADLGAPAVAVFGDVADIPGLNGELHDPLGAPRPVDVERHRPHAGSRAEPAADRAGPRAGSADRGACSPTAAVVRILSSPAVRARQTADIIAERLGLEVVESNRCCWRRASTRTRRASRSASTSFSRWTFPARPSQSATATRSDYAVELLTGELPQLPANGSITHVDPDTRQVAVAMP